jgi:hypothetical protein
MFREPTVLVLGAGASAPYGFPLGSQLVSSISSGISAIINERSMVVDYSDFNFLETPYETLRSWLISSPPAGVDKTLFWDGIREFQRDLANGPRSIDEFARINPKWRNLTKVLVAFELGRRVYKKHPASNSIWQISPQFLDHSETSWYSHLIHELRSGAQNPRDLGQNQLSIITFNYDRSLEFYIENSLGKGEIFSGFDYAEAPSVIHMHGEIPFPDTRVAQISAETFWPSVCQCVPNFVMVDEPRDDHSHNSYIAERMLAEATRIFFLGFDFHQQNNELLNIDRRIAERSIVLNWNGNHRVRQRAIDAGIDQENILSGTKSSPLEISNAIIEDGLFALRPH